MKTISVRTAYLDKGILKSNEVEVKTIGDINVLFNNAIQDAELFARLRKGKVVISRERDYLYISYLDVPKSNIIDKLYKLN
jgi:hypothetical protein